MSMLATSSRESRASAAPGKRGGAPISGWSSFGPAYSPFLLAVMISLLPAMLGGVWTCFSFDRYGWGMALLAFHQMAAWALAYRVPRPVRWGRVEWIAIALGTGLTIVVSAPMILPWLLLPVVPALLLRSACHCGPPLRVRPLIRVFSLASLAAVVTQLAGNRPGVGVMIAIVGASVLGLLALERLVVRETTPDSGGADHSRPRDT